MKSKIQTMKNTFASNLTAKGQSSSGSDTLNNLINKIPNINVGKKWATGTATMGEFVINVTGLQFRPTVIVTLLDTLSDNRFGGIYVAENIYGNTTRMNITFEIWNEKINTNTFDVSTNGFSFKTVYYWYGDALRWIAFE
ncbi:MAG TPA: hypothetical protein DIU45_04930 [Clostridium sp.]|nr:hypothetical protein [Clostridium sp.]